MLSTAAAARTEQDEDERRQEWNDDIVSEQDEDERGICLSHKRKDLGQGQESLTKA